MNTNSEFSAGKSESAPSPASSDQAQRNVFVRKNDQQLGPFTPDEVVGAMAMGRFSEEDYAWYPGIQDWQKLGALIPGVQTPRAVFKQKIGETLGSIVLILVPVFCGVTPSEDPSWIEQMIRTPVVSLMFIAFGCISLWQLWKR